MTWRTTLRRVERAASASEAILGSLRAAREARMGPIGWSLAGLHTASVVAALLVERHPDQWLQRRGYRPEEGPLGKLVRGLLPDRPDDVVEFASGAVVSVFGDVATYGDRVWRRPGPLQGMLKAAVQRLGTDIRLEAQGAAYRLAAMHPVGDYLGTPEPENLARRIQLRGAASVLLVGPTGTGKTTLARRVTHLLAPDRGFLCIGADLIGARGGTDVVTELVEALDPAAVLIDDVQSLFTVGDFDHRANGTLLPLLETLSGRVVFLTLMRDAREGGPRALPYGGKLSRDDALRGQAYAPGMRPGRVDLTVLIPLPGKPERKRIMEHYYGGALPAACQDEVVARTEYLPPAYLRELAVRLRTYGHEGWSDELDQIIAAAPDLKPPPDLLRRRARRAPLWQRLGLPKPKTRRELEAELAALKAAHVGGAL